MSQHAGPARQAPEERVWDPFVRIAHWLLVLGFAIAWLTEDGPENLHVWMGYLVGVIVVVRIVWGFVGTRHARFSDFLYGPVAGLSYLVNLLRFRARRYVGHSPAGAWMVYALLIGLIGTVGTGLVQYGMTRGAGPLAALHVATAPVTTVAPAGVREHEESAETNGEEGENAWKELHEFFAVLTLWLVGFHVAGVAWASFAHKENLARSMVTGRKRVGPADQP